MGKVIMSGIVPPLVVPCPYDPVFANNTWAEIIAACQSNNIPETWEVGDQKAMTINGTDYLIDIIGKNHDDYADGSGKAPLTFQMHDCYGTEYYMKVTHSTVGGWSKCDMRNTNLPKIMALMPDEVQPFIKLVNKLSNAGNQSTTINTTSDKLFLLSEIEIFGTSKNSAEGEGEQYEYYKAGNSKIKKLNGSNRFWFSRSERIGKSNCYCGVSEQGDSSFAMAANGYGPSFAFCF